MTTKRGQPMPQRIRALSAETDEELIDQASAALCVLSARFHTQAPLRNAFYASNRALSELRQIEQETRAIAASERRRQATAVPRRPRAEPATAEGL